MLPRVSRYKKRESDQSGFDYYEDTMLRDEGFVVGEDEKDDPPPSKRSLGGLGDVTPDGIRTPWEGFASTTGSALETFYITAAGGISPRFTVPFMQIEGSNGNITVTANPQISASVEGKVLTLVGVGSSVTLLHGTGLSLWASRQMVMDSGAVLNLIYTTGGSVWQETSRGRLFTTI